MPERLDRYYPRSLFNKFEFISGGATGWVFEVAPGIALKFLRPGCEEEFRREHNTYALIERSDPSPPPHFIQSFVRLPYAHFMQLMPDCLDFRLRANRRQDPKTLKCFEVLRLEPTAKIEQWAAELSSALAWLESIGLVQGDLRPPNLLLDGEDHMKLVDFDSCAKFGDLDPGLPPPWSSPHHRRYGAETEQYGFGSILYNVTHGLEPYEDKGPEAVELFRTEVFPELMSDSQLDMLTLRCWRSEFATLADLAEYCATLHGAKSAATTNTINTEYISTMQTTCEELLRTSLADLEKELP